VCFFQREIYHCAFRNSQVSQGLICLGGNMLFCEPSHHFLNPLCVGPSIVSVIQSPRLSLSLFLWHVRSTWNFGGMYTLKQRKYYIWQRKRKLLSSRSPSWPGYQIYGSKALSLNGRVSSDNNPGISAGGPIRGLDTNAVVPEERPLWQIKKIMRGQFLSAEQKTAKLWGDGANVPVRRRGSLCRAVSFPASAWEPTPPQCCAHQAIPNTRAAECSFGCCLLVSVWQGSLQ